MSEYPGVTSVRFPDSQIWKPDILLYNRFVIFTQRVINQPICITGLSKKEFHRNQTYLQKFKPGLGTISWELVNCLGIKVLVTVNGHWVCTTPRKTSQVTYVTMVPRGNETLRPLGVATGNALSVTRSEDTYVKTPPVGRRRQPMTSLPACHNISAAGRIHHQLLRLKLASEAWPEA